MVHPQVTYLLLWRDYNSILNKQAILFSSVYRPSSSPPLLPGTTVPSSCMTTQDLRCHGETVECRIAFSECSWATECCLSLLPLPQCAPICYSVPSTLWSRFWEAIQGEDGGSHATQAAILTLIGHSNWILPIDLSAISILKTHVPNPLMTTLTSLFTILPKVTSITLCNTSCIGWSRQ